MVEQGASGGLSFRLHRPGATGVELVGCFTGWLERPIRMSPLGDGWWGVELEMPPGDYEFRYLIDRRDWQTDFAASGVRADELAGWMSLLHVPAHAPLPESMPVGEREVDVKVRPLRPVRAA